MASCTDHQGFGFRVSGSRYARNARPQTRNLAALGRAVVLGLLFLAVTGCGEMYHQPAYRPQDPPRLVPPVGSVPVTGQEPVFVGLDGSGLTNPIANDQESFRRGQALYNINCALCHGLQGRGNGPVAPAFTPQPADLTSSRVQNLNDGDIFLRITNGFSTMPAFRRLLEPNERWDIVNYVRSFRISP